MERQDTHNLNEEAYESYSVASEKWAKAYEDMVFGWHVRNHLSESGAKHVQAFMETHNQDINSLGVLRLIGEVYTLEKGGATLHTIGKVRQVYVVPNETS